MRTSVGFNASVAVSPKSTEAAVARGNGGPHSAWHSPVPYLFGGLAAMLGLIAFALLILACSYWKLSSFLESEGDSPEESTKPEESEEKREPVKYEERIVVIMAGEEKPRYLATPSCSRASSFGDNYVSSSTRSSCSSSSSDCGRSNNEVDGKKADDVVIEAESLSNLEEPGYQNHTNQEQWLWEKMCFPM